MNHETRPEGRASPERGEAASPCERQYGAQRGDENASTPAIILVNPQMGENIGAVARAMMNFGLRELRLVAPRDGWPNPAAEAMAAHGVEIIHNAKLYATTRDAIADLHYVYASTARDRRVRKPQRTPRESVADMAARGGAGQKTGLLFGPERTGLENEDIALAQAIVTVPTDPNHASLNIAQCAVIMAYEWFSRESGQWPVVSGQEKEECGQQAAPALSAAEPPAHVSASMARSGAIPKIHQQAASALSAAEQKGDEQEAWPAGHASPERGGAARPCERQQARRGQNKDLLPATQEELNAFFDHLETALDATYFFKLDEKKPRMWRNLRATLQRAELSAQEVHTLYGMVVALEKGAKKV